MVATRRGGRVSSPTTNVEEKQSVVQATPSTARRTRRAQQDECNAQQTLGETCKTGPLETPATSKKRCTRSSRLHSPEEPSTPVSSVHEGEMSDVESLCSAVSDAEPPLTRARGRMRPLSGKDQEHETSEVESCSSAVSPAKPKISSSRSTRRKPAQTSSQSEVDSGKVGTVPEAEPSSSAVSESQRVTRSQRKAAPARASVRRHAEDSELSEAESCTSSISGRRSRRLIRPIPIHLDELPESSQCPTRTTRQTKASRRTAVSTEEDEKEQCCDSEGFESGPTYSLSTCRRGRSQSAVSKTALDSESEDVNSSGGSRGTPCSSRAGSGSSSRRAPTSRRSTRSSNVLETTQEPCEEESSFNDSKSESTVFGEDMDSTLVEEQQVQTSGEQQSLVNAEITSSGADDEKVEKEKVDESEDMELPGSACAEDVSEPAVITKDLKEELSSESKAGEASEMDMEEVIPPSQPVQTLQSVPETAGGTDSEMTELIEEKQKAADEPLEDEDEADVEILPSVEETLEAQVKASQQGKVSIESESEQQPKAAVVQKTKNISLLHSSDDEDSFSEEEEDRMSDDEDDPGNREERAGSSSVSKVASASAVEGLFMIDTRPGQDADQQYYREEEEEEEAHGKAQQEDEEEFIDEEGDEEDDEDSKVLFFSRNPQLKDLSSRIDPGLRVKELGGLYISFDGSKSKPVSSSLQKLKEKKSHDEIMKKSVIGPDFEKKDAVPPYSESKQALKLKRRAEREKSTGDGWFNMKAPEISQELKGDLKLLKMRGSLDPKRFYKKNDRDGFPKYFQMGTVVDSPADFYHSRIPKKERKRTMVEELLNDAEFRLKNKKKYQQIIAEKAALTAGKRNKKKKFHKK